MGNLSKCEQVTNNDSFFIIIEDPENPFLYGHMSDALSSDIDPD